MGKLSVSLLVGFAAWAAAGAARAQVPTPPAPQASAPAPSNAASRVMPSRNAAVMAAENAKEPGVMRPEERVVPQIAVPLRSRTTARVAASAPAGGAPGAVNDKAARCLAAAGPAQRARCERERAAAAAASATSAVSPGR